MAKSPPLWLYHIPLERARRALSTTLSISYREHAVNFERKLFWNTGTIEGNLIEADRGPYFSRDLLFWENRFGRFVGTRRWWGLYDSDCSWLWWQAATGSIYEYDESRTLHEGSWSSSRDGPAGPEGKRRAGNQDLNCTDCLQSRIEEEWNKRKETGLVPNKYLYLVCLVSFLFLSLPFVIWLESTNKCGNGPQLDPSSLLLTVTIFWKSGSVSNESEKEEITRPFVKPVVLDW